LSQEQLLPRQILPQQLTECDQHVGSGKLAAGSKDLQETARIPVPIQKIKALLIVLGKFGAVIVLESSGDLGYLCKVNYKSSEKST
jgi:hypothetical protein